MRRRWKPPVSGCAPARAGRTVVCPWPVVAIRFTVKASGGRCSPGMGNGPDAPEVLPPTRTPVRDGVRRPRRAPSARRRHAEHAAQRARTPPSEARVAEAYRLFELCVRPATPYGPSRAPSRLSRSGHHARLHDPARSGDRRRVHAPPGDGRRPGARRRDAEGAHRPRRPHRPVAAASHEAARGGPPPRRRRPRPGRTRDRARRPATSTTSATRKPASSAR